MSEFEGFNLGPASDEEFRTVVDWLKDFEITEYVGSGYEKELEGVDPSRIWTEYMSGVEGDYAQSGFHPPEGDWVPQGYWVGQKPWGTDSESKHIWTYGYELCSCDGEEDCTICGGSGDLGYNFVELAREFLQAQYSENAKNSGAVFCIECGQKLPETSKFCPTCGTKAVKV